MKLVAGMQATLMKWRAHAVQCYTVFPPASPTHHFISMLLPVGAKHKLPAEGALRFEDGKELHCCILAIHNLRIPQLVGRGLLAEQVTRGQSGS